jgi:tRNA pseudouridine38-40 synthase
MRIALGIEYCGRAYLGWERQKEGLAVQEVLENALARVATVPVRTYCAGRTDTGVHAYGQVVHFDCPLARPMQAWLRGTNTYLPDDVRVRWAQLVPDTFHARFRAFRRYYRYVVFNDPVAPAIAKGLVTWEYRELQLAAMQRAAQALVGTHDFDAYRASRCQAPSPVRTIYDLTLSQSRQLIYIDVHANGFLHHMVRNIVGVLLDIGAGQRPPQWAAEVLAGRDRRCGGVTAKPDGLYFVNVSYPEDFNIPVTLPTSPAFW